MNEDKDKRLADFQKQEKETVNDDWTEEEILEVAKKIIKKLKLEGELFKG